MSLASQPAYRSPIFNSGSFSSTRSAKGKRPTLQNFAAGVTAPFVRFSDGSVQTSASQNSTISNLTKNTQLSAQPFKNQSYIVRGDEVESVFLPTSSLADGYEIEIWNGQLSTPFMLVSERHKMFNTLFLPYGEKQILVRTNQLVRLRFFENSWSLLLF